MQPVSLDNKRIINMILLCICLAMIGISFFAPLLIGGGTDALGALVWNALLIHFLVLFLPARLFMSRRGGGKHFGLKKVSRGEWLWAAAFGVGMFFFVTSLNGFMILIWQALGVPALQSSVTVNAGGGWRLLAAIFFIAIVPAYVEENLFRGALLFSWAPQNRTRAIFHSALLFALFHAQITSLPPLLVMGLILATITLMSGSCYPAMAVHGVHNLITVLFVNLAGNASAGEAGAVVSLEMLPSLLVYAAIGIGISLLSYQGLRRSVLKRQALHKLLSGNKTLTSEEGAFDPAGKQPLHIGTSRLSVIFTYILMLLYNAFTFWAASLPVAT